MVATKPPLATYTDAQVTMATGLHQDNLRRLITWRAVVPVQSGGGRGRIRLWATRQALRIAVTAQFVEAGYSLQMAHTLTYCLPLDDLLNTFDPDILSGVLAGESGEGLDWNRARLKALTSDPDFNDWPGENYMGSQTLIVDQKYLYSDVVDGLAFLHAIIDPVRQRVAPLYSPNDFIYGSGMTEVYGLQPRVDTTSIDPKTLLIDKVFLGKDSERRRKAFDKLHPPEVPRSIIDIGRLVCKSLTLVNVAFGMTACIRRLSGLPSLSHPIELTA